MPLGGGVGRPRKPPSRIAKEPWPEDVPVKCKRGRKAGVLWNGIKPKHLARDTLESRIRELVKRGDEESKQEACKWATQLLQYEQPKLQAVLSQTEVKVTYVARLPSPVMDIDEWQKQTIALLNNPETSK